MSFEQESRRLTRIRPNLERRALILQTTRQFFIDNGFLEVETPLRVPAVAPEEYIVPFTSDGWFLSTSPELHMKRLLAAGYDRLFQICHCFRKGESGRKHNPEFTMIEWYRRGATYREVIDDTQNLVLTIAGRLGMGHAIPYQGTEIDITKPWPKASIREKFFRSAGWDPVAHLDVEKFDVDLVTKVIPGFDPTRPVVLKDYPAAMASLARLSKYDPAVAERAEVFIGGLEIANAYSELNDPEEQKARFEHDAAEIKKLGRVAGIPHRFLECLPFLPDCGGIALGLDRLVMLFCDTDSLQDVLAFPVDET